jgi:hypothetical protein
MEIENKIISYLLLKMRLNKNNASIMTQNQGLVRRFLKGSYPSLPKIFTSSPSIQSYALTSSERRFSKLKNSLNASIFYKF